MDLEEIKKINSPNTFSQEECFTLTFDPLTAVDMPSVLELKKALLFPNFLSYFESLGTSWQKNLAILLTKVNFNKEGKVKHLGDSSVFQTLSVLELEKVFYQVLQERKTLFELEGDFNYLSLEEQKKNNVFLETNLCVKTYLAFNFPKEVTAFAFLSQMEDATLGYLFSSFSKLSHEKNKLEKTYLDKTSQVKGDHLLEKKELSEKTFDLFFSEEVQKNLKEIGLF